MSEDLIERLRARGKVKDFQPGLPVCIEAAAEIERLRAKLASAKEVIAPFAEVAEWDIGDIEADDDRYYPMSPRYAVGGVLKVGHLRAAAEWMEKGE